MTLLLLQRLQSELLIMASSMATDSESDDKNQTNSSIALLKSYFIRKDSDSCLCRLCKKNIKAPNSNTTNLRKHVQRQHVTEYGKIMGKCKIWEVQNMGSAKFVILHFRL